MSFIMPVLKISLNVVSAKSGQAQQPPDPLRGEL